MPALWYPAAVRRPVAGHTYGPWPAPPLGLVLHVNDAYSDDLFGWISGNPSGMSCHWQINLTGRVYQYLPADVSSWAQIDGNLTYWSVETSGRAGDLMTDPQIAALTGLVRWLHTEHGMPLTLADKPGQHGLGWHGMGGAAWGHPNCPGVRKGQRQKVLDLAGAAPLGDGTAITEEEDVAFLLRNKSKYVRVRDPKTKKVSSLYCLPVLVSGSQGVVITDPASAVAAVAAGARELQLAPADYVHARNVYTGYSKWSSNVVL